jgi:ribosomal subunit interface protein
MKITYTGRHMALAPSQTVELEAEFGKISKLLDTPKGEGEARVVFSHEHGANQAEVTVLWRHHEIAGKAEHADLFTAIHAAVQKVNTQIVRQRARARDVKRVAVQ